jgi:hypothetical protein
MDVTRYVNKGKSQAAATEPICENSKCYLNVIAKEHFQHKINNCDDQGVNKSQNNEVVNKLELTAGLQLKSLLPDFQPKTTIVDLDR